MADTSWRFTYLSHHSKHVCGIPEVPGRLQSIHHLLPLQIWRGTGAGGSATPTSTTSRLTETPTSKKGLIM
ncbi:unnamed protein product [Lota lota]